MMANGHQDTAEMDTLASTEADGLLQPPNIENNNMDKNDFQIDHGCTIDISRPAYNQDDIDKTYGRIDKPAIPISTELAGKVRSACVCSGACLVARLFALFPFVSVMRCYKWKSWIMGDIIAGLCVGVIHIPQCLGFAILTSLPPIYGLYSTLYPVVIYFIFGTSRHISVGTMALISLMIGAVVEREAALYTPPPPTHEVTNTTGVVFETNDGIYNNDTGYDLATTPSASKGLDPEMEAFRVDIATSVTLLVGVIQIGMYLLNLGVVAKFMPMSFIGGFMTGAAFHIITSQVPFMLGVKPPRQVGIFRFPKIWFHIFRLLPTANPAEVTISIICMCILLGLKEYINDKYKDKLKIPIPAEIIVVVLTIAISYFAKLNERLGVRIIANVPSGLPYPKVPSLYHSSSYIADAFAIAIVSYAINMSLAKSFAMRFKYKLDQNQEILAYGLMHVISSFFSCFGGAQAPPRTLVHVNTGGRTQVASLVCALMVLLVCLFLGPAIEPLPNCVLGAIIAVALTPLLKSFRDLPGMYRTNRCDCLIWVVTFLAVVILDVDVGLYVGVLTGLVTIVSQTIGAGYSHLRQAGTSELYLSQDKFEIYDKNSRYIKIFRFEAPLYFANVDRFKAQVQKCTSGIIDATSNCISVETNDVIEKDVDGSRLTKAIIIDCSCLFYIDLMGLNALKAIQGNNKDLDIQVLFTNCPDSLVAKMKANGMNVDRVIYPSIYDAVCLLTKAGSSRTTLMHNRL